MPTPIYISLPSLDSSNLACSIYNLDISLRLEEYVRDLPVREPQFELDPFTGPCG
jgi:hypothetical protein